MDWDVIEAKVVQPGLLEVRFADGLRGSVRFQGSAYTGVFEKLKDPEFFRQMYVNDYFITWPGELDLAPDAMHQAIKNTGEWILR